MAFTLDYSTSVGQVRLIINDTDDTAPLYDDAAIETFLLLEDDSVKLAAAQALDAIASNQALLLQKVRLDGGKTETDGPAVAAALRNHAKQLREQVKAKADSDDAADGLFDIAEQVPDVFAARERIYKQWQRGL